MLILTRPALKNLPLTDSGFLEAIEAIRASAFFCKSSFAKSLMPILFMIVPSSVTLNSMRPYLDYFTLSSRTSGFTKVPDLTLGIRPLGPRIRAKALREGIYSGVAMILSKLRVPLAISKSKSASPMVSAPTLLRSEWNSSSAKTATRTSFPVPAGRMQVPLMFCPPLVGSTLSLSTTSTASLNFLSLEASLAVLKTS
jgi:hypothetical protein